MVEIGMILVCVFWFGIGFLCGRRKRKLVYFASASDVPPATINPVNFAALDDPCKLNFDGQTWHDEEVE